MFPCQECEKCERYDRENMRQRNKIYCIFSCEPFQDESLKNAFAYNYAVSGDPNIYGNDGTIWTPNGIIKAEGKE